MIRPSSIRYLFNSIRLVVINSVTPRWKKVEDPRLRSRLTVWSTPTHVRLDPGNIGPPDSGPGTRVGDRLVRRQTRYGTGRKSGRESKIRTCVESRITVHTPLRHWMEEEGRSDT